MPRSVRWVDALDDLRPHIGELEHSADAGAGAFGLVEVDGPNHRLFRFRFATGSTEHTRQRRKGVRAGKREVHPERVLDRAPRELLGFLEVATIGEDQRSGRPAESEVDEIVRR